VRPKGEIKMMKMIKRLQGSTYYATQKHIKKTSKTIQVFCEPAIVFLFLSKCFTTIKKEAYNEYNI